MSFPAPFAGPLAAGPDEVALRFGDQRWTWAEWGQRVADRCALLIGRGVRPGDRIGVDSDDVLSVAVSVLAGLSAGAHVAPLSGSLRSDELRRRLDSIGARWHLSADSIDTRPGPSLSRVHAQGEPALLVFTSGTTDLARAVVLPQAALVASADGVVEATGLARGDAWFDPLPLSHVGGLGALFRCARVGAEVILTEGFDPAVARGLFDSGQVTHASLVARMLARILEEPVSPRGLRSVLVGGGRTEPGLLARARRAGLPAISTYGLSEAGSTVTLQRPEEPIGEAGDAGWPLPNRRVRIGDDGQIEVEGPCLMAGYAGEPPVGAWLRTGDFGRLLPDGRLIVLDRRSDLIVSGGENVSPLAVESVLQAVESIDEVCVVGLPHPAWGQQVVALVRWKAAPDLSAAEAAVAGLPPWQRPRRWLERTEPLPRNALGKLLRHEAREQVEDAAPE